jgi:hypothetical protein
VTRRPTPLFDVPVEVAGIFAMLAEPGRTALAPRSPGMFHRETPGL